MTTMADYVRAFAAPVGWRGAAPDAREARAHIEALFAAASAEELEPIFQWFANRGHRGEYASYEAHAGGAWKPDPRDRGLSRKAEFTIAHRDRMRGRALVALDAMRASALAGWAVTAGLLDGARATASAAPTVALALAKHASWSDVAEQLLLGLGFAEGEVEPSLRAAILTLDGPAWPRETPALEVGPPTAATGDDADGSPAAGAFTVLAMRLAVDCPGCEHALALGGIVDRASCRRCGTEVTLAPADWAYFFAEDAQKRRRGIGGDDPITSDFGARFFSRRVTTREAVPACSCGSPLDVTALAAGVVACACGRSSSVRPADPLALAIDARPRFVVAPLPRPIDASATFECAACGAAQPLGGDPSRVRTCAVCASPTFVDDAAYARSFDPPRRPTFYLLVAS